MLNWIFKFNTRFFMLALGVDAVCWAAMIFFGYHYITCG